MAWWEHKVDASTALKVLLKIQCLSQCSTSVPHFDSFECDLLDFLSFLHFLALAPLLSLELLMLSRVSLSSFVHLDFSGVTTATDYGLLKHLVTYPGN